MGELLKNLHSGKVVRLDQNLFAQARGQRPGQVSESSPTVGRYRIWRGSVWGRDAGYKWSQERLLIANSDQRVWVLQSARTLPIWRGESVIAPQFSAHLSERTSRYTPPKKWASNTPSRHKTPQQIPSASHARHMHRERNRRSAQ